MKALKAFVCRPRPWWKTLGILVCVGLVYALPIMTIPGMAAIYLKIDGIDGEVVAKGFEKWIEVDSTSFKTKRTISAPGGGVIDRDVSAPTFEDLAVEKVTDKASPLIFRDAVIGSARPTARLHFTRNVNGLEVTYQTITLSDVLVSSFSQAATSDGSLERFSLNFTKFAITNISIDPASGKITGTVGAGYDLTTAKGY